MWEIVLSKIREDIIIGGFANPVEIIKSILL